MTVFTRWFFVSGLFFAIALAAQADELAFHDAWVAAAPDNAHVQAAYICFINNSDKDKVITGVSAKGFGSAMLHNTMQHEGMSVMHNLSTLAVPAHKMVTLEPGSMHIMLMDPDKIAKPGDTVALTVQYQDGTSQTFALPVKKADEVPTSSMQDDMHEHHHEH